MKKISRPKDERQAVQKLDLLAVGQRAFEGFGVRDEVFEKKGSDGYDAAERMQTAQQERNSLAGAQRSDAGFDLGATGAGATGLAVDATMTAPYVVRYEN